MRFLNGMPKSEVINYKYSKLTDCFRFKSNLVGYCKIPIGFTCDWESVPLLKGTSKVSGLVHDYLCRSDSKPLVTKKVAADVYLECLKSRGTGYIKRYLKYWTVRVSPGYFHKKLVAWEFNA